MFSNRLNFDPNLLISALYSEGYAIIEEALDPTLTLTLYQQLDSMQASEFHRAGIGREDNFQIAGSIRGDRIHWLEGSTPAEEAYLQAMEQLRLLINRALFLGLFDYEAHFAYYPEGTFYKRHLDAFKGASQRVVTTVFYLNPHWQASDGGELLIYADESATQPIQCVSPKAGRLVCFLSDQFSHEVLSAQRMRYSIAGWFRINTNMAGQIDPPR